MVIRMLEGEVASFPLTRHWYLSALLSSTRSKSARLISVAFDVFANVH